VTTLLLMLYCPDARTQVNFWLAVSAELFFLMQAMNTTYHFVQKCCSFFLTSLQVMMSRGLSTQRSSDVADAMKAGLLFFEESKVSWA
jgi:hypothetical protein